MEIGSMWFLQDGLEHPAFDTSVLIIASIALETRGRVSLTHLFSKCRGVPRPPFRFKEATVSIKQLGIRLRRQSADRMVMYKNVPGTGDMVSRRSHPH
jgi:hypothetical protein